MSTGIGRQRWRRENSTPETGCGAETVGLSCWGPDHQILDDLYCAEQGEQLLVEALIVGVNVQVFVHIVEGQLAVVVVEIDAHLAGDEARWQRSEGHGQRLQLGASLQPQGQVPRVGVQWLEAFPQGRLLGHAQSPVPLADLHLPVLASRAKALHPDSAPPAVKALVVVGDILPLKATAHPLLISGDEQIRVGCVQIQSHLNYRETSQSELPGRFRGEDTHWDTVYMNAVPAASEIQSHTARTRDDCEMMQN